MKMQILKPSVVQVSSFCVFYQIPHFSTQFWDIPQTCKGKHNLRPELTLLTLMIQPVEAQPLLISSMAIA